MKWFLDPTRTEYNTPVAAFVRSRQEDVPTPKIVHHRLFGAGQIVGPSSDYFDELGILSRVRFASCEGSFRKDFLTCVAA